MGIQNIRNLMSDNTAAIQAMIISMCGPLMNKIKMCFQYPRKNVDLANNKDIRNLIYLLGE